MSLFTNSDYVIKKMTDKELLRVSKQFVKGFLGKRESQGHCFALSTALQGFLFSLYQCQTELIEGVIETPNCMYEHFWLLMEDGRILDPTANQFNAILGKDMPTVYLGDLPNWYDPALKRD